VVQWVVIVDQVSLARLAIRSSKHQMRDLETWTWAWTSGGNGQWITL